LVLSLRIKPVIIDHALLPPPSLMEEVRDFKQI
jgi:hypothetical protein